MSDQTWLEFLINKVPWGKQFEFFLEEFAKESDRACVILSAAALDNTLGDILKARLVPVGTSKDDLMENPNSPLSTFSVRIDLAHRLGLISTRLCRDLHIIRAIRNDFAHDIAGCNFDNQATRNRVTELARSLGFHDRKTKRQDKTVTPRDQFMHCVALFLMHLWDLLTETESIEPAEIEAVYRRWRA